MGFCCEVSHRVDAKCDFRWDLWLFCGASVFLLARREGASHRMGFSGPTLNSLISGLLWGAELAEGDRFQPLVRIDGPEYPLA